MFESDGTIHLDPGDWIVFSNIWESRVFNDKLFNATFEISQ